MGNLQWKTQYDLCPLVCECEVKALSMEAFEIIGTEKSSTLNKERGVISAVNGSVSLVN